MSEALVEEISKVAADMSLLQQEFALFKEAAQSELTQFVNSASEQDATFAQTA